MIETNQRATQCEERLIDVHAPLVADRRPPVAIQPGERPLDHLAMAPQVLTVLDALAGNADRNVRPGKRLAAAGQIVRLVGKELAGPLPPLARRSVDGGDGISQVPEHHAVIAVRTGQPLRQRHLLPLGNQVPFRTRLVAIGPIGPTGSPPFCRDTGAVQAGAFPVNSVGLPEPIEQRPMQPLPDPGVLPVLNSR